MWQKEWGPRVDELREIEVATGVTPSALLNAPQLFGLVLEVVTAYNVLASRRTAGIALNPISLAEIAAYVQIFGPPTIPMDMFVELLGIMDIKFLELSNASKHPSNS